MFELSVKNPKFVSNVFATNKAVADTTLVYLRNNKAFCSIEKDQNILEKKLINK